MKTFTCITLIRNSFHVTQHGAEGAEEALRLHLGNLPYDDGEGPFDEELRWLQDIADGLQEVTVLPLGEWCKKTWMWLEGTSVDPKYHTYVVQSDIGDS